MRKLRLIINIFLFLLVMAYALAFAAHNSQTLALDFLLGQPVSLPASIWLGIVLLTGTVLGLFSGLLIQLRQKLRIRRLSKELQDTKQRLNKLP